MNLYVEEELFLSKQAEYRRKTYGLSNYRKGLQRKERNRRLLGLGVAIAFLIIAGYLFFNNG
jgi:hypothetical protein